MTAPVRIHQPRPSGRLAPQQRRRVPSLGPRPRVAIMGHRGPGSLLADDVRRLAQRADLTFHALDRSPDLDTATVLLRRVDVLAVTGACVPLLDPALLERTPRLRAVVLPAGALDLDLDLDLLDDYGVGVDVVTWADRAAWGAHLLAVLDERPLNPRVWPNLLYPEAI